MSTPTYQYLLADIHKALSEKHLYSAVQSLQGLATLLKASALKDEVDTLAASYHILLDYLVKGTKDPARNNMYTSFTRRAYELTDVLKREGELTDHASFYTTSLHTLQGLKGSEYAWTDSLTMEESERNLFDAVWLSPIWSADDAERVDAFMHSDHIDEVRQLLLLSAATLSAMSFFDINKYRLLLDYVLSENIKLRVRAIVGLVFLQIVHDSRMTYYPDELNQFKLCTETEGFCDELEIIQSQLFLTLEAKRIEKDLEEKIIPQMMKHAKHIRLDRSIGLDDLKDGRLEAELNPEWEEDGTPSKLMESMNELVDLQQRGADMYLSSFKMLKQRFPFFSVASNWFWPFTFAHPEISDKARQNDILSLLLKNGGLCDSDKYSLCLMLSMVEQKTGMPWQSEQMKDMMNGMAQQSDEYEDAETKFRKEVRSYIQGFYRFCHFFNHRSAFVNPFTYDLTLINYSVFDSALSDDRFVERMAHFLFRNKSYAQALYLFDGLSNKERLTADTWQKIGFCYEQEKVWSKATEAYEKANLLKDGSEWTLRRLAVCYKRTDNYTDALTAYNELAEMFPEDAHIALRQAECLIHLARYDEAFKFLYKADYLAPDEGNALRALAWCSLLTKKYGQAETYYQKVLAHSPTPTDYLNAGHAAWLQGNVAEAVARYHRSLPEENKENFLIEEKDFLCKHGISPLDIFIMTDAVINIEAQ